VLNKIQGDGSWKIGEPHPYSNQQLSMFVSNVSSMLLKGDELKKVCKKDTYQLCVCSLFKHASSVNQYI
jgi:hypothetical protein